MAKKATYKLFNGTAFEDIYFKTSVDQVEGLQDALSNVVTTPTWEQVTGKPTWIGASKPTYNATDVGARPAGNVPWTEVSGKPTIPTIPSVMNTTEGNTGTATTQRTINAANLKSIILNHSPAGARPSSWAQVSDKPGSMSISDVTSAEDNTSGNTTKFITPWELNQSIVNVGNLQGYLKSVSYSQITGSKPPVNATTNVGTVTNVSAGTQVNGLTLSVATGTTTPTITTSISNQANFRTAIGAGTSSLTIGTTSTTAKAGNYHPTWAQVTSKPTWIGASKPTYTASEVGAAPTTHTHTIAQVDGLQTALDSKGTSNLAIGTTSSTAKAGNYHPTWSQVTSKPTWIGASKPTYTETEIETYLGYTPQDSAYRRPDIRTTGADDNFYVTELGVKTYVDSMIGSVYRPAGNWNASTNTPALTTSMPANIGKVYRVSVAGTNLGYTWSVGDKLTFIEGGAVAKWDNVDDVTTVAGRKGDVVLTKSDVGLGSVNNYGIASQTVAQKGTSNATYMTPLRTKQAITKNISDLLVVTEGMILDGLDKSTGLTTAYDISQAINNAVSTRVPTSRTVNGKALSANISLTAANVGAAPTSHTHTIAQVTNLQTTLDGKSGTGHTHSAATQSAAGFLSAADKIRLDGIATGAQKNVATNLGNSVSGLSYTITSSTGDNTTISGATETQAGLVTTESQIWLGAKTFIESPTVPNPTNDNHAARKKYVDNKVSGALKQVSWNASTGTMIVEVI